MKAVKMGACNTQVDSTQLHSVTRITLHKTLKKQGGILSFVRVISIIMMHRRLTLICARVRIEIHIGLASWGAVSCGGRIPTLHVQDGRRKALAIRSYRISRRLRLRLRSATRASHQSVSCTHVAKKTKTRAFPLLTDQTHSYPR